MHSKIKALTAFYSKGFMPLWNAMLISPLHKRMAFFLCMRPCIFFLLFFFLVSITSVNLTFAMGNKNKQYPVGMRTYGVWKSGDVDGEERIDIAVWYPAKTQGRPKVLEGWVVPVAGSTRPQAGFFPIILVSHDTASSRFANNNLSIAIAAAGNIVIAVTHSNDNVISSKALYTAELLAKRPHQLLIALETILDSKELGPHADESRIGLLGVGFGAITAMQTAGKTPKIETLDTFCSRLSSSDIFCNSWSGHRLRDMANDIQQIQNLYGEDVLTPPLDLFAPELEKALVQKESVPQKVEEKTKKGMYASIKEWLSKKEDEEPEQQDFSQSTITIEATEKKDTTNQKASLIVVDFQGGEMLGGTVLGYTFVNFPSKDDFIPSAEEEEEEPATPITPPPLPRVADNRVHHRPSSKRAIRSIALLAPAGGMLFTGDTPLQIPAAIVNAEKDMLYPYAVHSSPYEKFFVESPQVKVVPEADHFSLFAPCSNDLMTMLEEVCGTIKGKKREKLNQSNDTFLANFFLSTLGGGREEPEPSGFVVKPKKKFVEKK